MINLRENTVFVVYGDGSSAPFDAAELQSRVLNVCLSAGMTDAWVAQDIALSVEFALTCKFHDSDTPKVSAEEIDGIVVRILEDLGYSAIAAEYRRLSRLQTAVVRISVSSGLKEFIGGELGLAGTLLSEIVCRVRNTLISIGAEHPSAELVLELARHFRDYVLKGKPSLEIETQAVHRSGGAWILDREWIEKKLPEETRIWVEKRVLMLHPVNLKIFQYLRVDVRLTGLLSDLPLKPPLTELSVTPLFHEPAQAVDSVCLAADSVCRENGAGFAVPLKLLLCFPDAGIFTGEWMDCRTPPSAEKMSRDLAESFCSMLSRIPFKVICK